MESNVDSLRMEAMPLAPPLLLLLELLLLVLLLLVLLLLVLLLPLPPGHTVPPDSQPTPQLTV
jgi:hypothetical protein